MKITSRRVELVLLALSFALAYALGFSILYSKEHQTSTALATIQNNDRVKQAAVFETCLKTRPRTTQFIISLLDTFQRNEIIAHDALKSAKPGTTIYRTRRASVMNYQIIVRELRNTLPIKCKLGSGT